MNPRTITCVSIALAAVNPLADGSASMKTLSGSGRRTTSLLLGPCADSSHQISQYGADVELAPCVLYDIRPPPLSSPEEEFAEVALVQVTPSICHNHRDGAITALKFLNDDNGGRGTQIGYKGASSYVKFRLVSIVGGNNKNIGNDAYSEAHIEILDGLFDTIKNAQFILGSCSFAAAADKPIALKRQKIVFSQVGPPGFYKDVIGNPYVFGIHVNSDTYPLPALSALQFHLDATGVPTNSQPVKVVYRDRSEFFYSTCRSAIDRAVKEGFDVDEIEFNPDAFEGGADVPNSQNVEFLESLADRACGPAGDQIVNVSMAPAIFACVQGGEADVLLKRIRSNGCRPPMAWFTTATWGWATDNMDTIPYFQGGGQWHENFVYSDKFFESGRAVLDYGLGEFGYKGSYDHVVSYAMPMLIMELLQSFYRVTDAPNVTETFASRYEELRRSLSTLNARTIFGPVSFNEYQRNNGRGAAGTQWIPLRGEGSGAGAFVLGCTSPLDQADASVVVPSPSALQCHPGSHVAIELVELEPAILEDKCTLCPADTFAMSANADFACAACLDGSVSEEGASNCIMMEDNMITPSLKVMGYLFLAISWSMAIGYMGWIRLKRKDAVVRIGQIEFLVLICCGAMISTSTIIPLTLAEADPLEDTAAASKSCRAIPFLYSIGWVLMYSSLTAKSWRLVKVSRSAMQARRVKVSAKEMFVIIVALLAVDLVILIAWVALDPLEYVRSEVSQTLNRDTGVLIIETAGQCQGSGMWRYLGPIIGIHVSLMIVTNILLWKVKDLSDRYQEQKYVAMASLYLCELLLLGLPILFAVKESADARYFVMVGVIFLTDTGVLSLIFIPKIKYAKEGLPEGQSVVQSMHLPTRFTSAQSQAPHRHTFNQRTIYLSQEHSAVEHDAAAPETAYVAPAAAPGGAPEATGAEAGAEEPAETVADARYEAPRGGADAGALAVSGESPDDAGESAPKGLGQAMVEGEPEEEAADAEPLAVQPLLKAAPEANGENTAGEGTPEKSSGAGALSIPPRRDVEEGVAEKADQAFLATAAAQEETSEDGDTEAAPESPQVGVGQHEEIAKKRVRWSDLVSRSSDLVSRSLRIFQY